MTLRELAITLQLVGCVLQVSGAATKRYAFWLTGLATWLTGFAVGWALDEAAKEQNERHKRRP